MMRMTALGLAFLLVAACSSETDRLPAEVRAVIDGAESFELISVHPMPLRDEGSDRVFRRHPVLGRATADEGVAAEVRALLYRGINASDGTVAACFNPRHAFRAKRGDRTVDVLICYECLTIEIWPAQGERFTIPTSRGPEPAMSALYTRLGLPIEGRKK